MSLISDLTSRHLVIVGSTDSGKSTFAEYLFAKTPHKAIFYDQQDERTIGTLLQDENEVKIPFTPAILARYNKILIYSHFRHEDKVKEIESIVNNLMLIGKHYPPRRIWCNLFVTEAHELANKMDRDSPLNKIATKGIRYGISLIADTQRPSQISHTILTQAPNHIIFKLSDYEYPYFRDYKIPIDEFGEHIKKPYHFVLYKDGEITYYNPISLSFYNKKSRRQKNGK